MGFHSFYRSLIAGFWTAVFVLVAFTAPDVVGQRVRLRGHNDPSCTILPNGQWKFADVYADGNIAVLGSSNCTSVFIFDISDPSQPILASRYDTPTPQPWLEAIVIGNRGYFGSNTNGGVHIVDLTDPYHPALLGVVDPTHGNGFAKVHEMVVWGNILVENFNGSPNRIVKFINIADPADPVFIRDLTTQENTWNHAMHIRGNRMVTSGFGTTSARGKTEIYDVSNIQTQAPTLLSVIQDFTEPIAANDSSMHSSWMSEDGNYLYSCREAFVFEQLGYDYGDVRVYDIHDPAQPVLVNSVKQRVLGLNAATPHNPVVKGNRLYVSWYDAGLQIFDISDPVHPVRIGQYDTSARTYVPFTSSRTTGSPDFKPGEPICGSFSQRSAPRGGLSGAWAVYPFLGDDKIVVGDMMSGLYIFDTTRITSPLKNAVSDFDGDGKTDLSVFRPDLGDWMINNSSTNFTYGVHFGTGGDRNIAGDFDGDGKADIAVWRPSNGVWFISGSSSGFAAIQFGTDGDIPVAADYDADGRTDVAVWRPSTGTWYILRSTLSFYAVSWGLSGDKVFSGDYEGDGKADFCVYRPSDGVWYILQSSSNTPLYFGFGLSDDQPVLADFDGDDKLDISVYRTATGYWYVTNSSNGSINVFRFGLPGADVAIPADYDGDSRADIAVFRPGLRDWYRLNSSDGAFVAHHFGGTGDMPSPSSVQPK